ncbi:TonB-dependent receptor [Caulobacter vibrioides]|uniref:TonB-dependent receptor n=1 Tax=Caulobacter vibrioides (strain NA1000 / CB15N) TaxID=565050 RepID=A0A0H3CDA5_CAUVN|nr:TonB-dependent receptor [Caulobacter vibrioides]YP_002518817.1 TonB-dependent receptor [Caulobacter vibrioides NA1000]ACL96909.1 TonB-dependent receptor [Caulobacter vibrioides NA1000]ATC30158.1 TonB-dependent receptor [Caulobacter vibrioides]QXZ51684.1 TonB-dependent receptor [Caulobacter vibrioides]
MRFSQVLCGTASAVVLAGLGATSAAQAQETDIPTVDSIIVTAQKREQNLQDVPVVVTAVGAKLLQDTGVRDIKDLTILTPGLTVTSTSSEASTTARVRGVGTVGDNPGLESSVGVVIDGVYRPRNGVGFGDLGEMERIEVLKGPQGTLFGKNTSAGVINVVTKEPEFGFGASAEVTLGNYDAKGVAASVTGPLMGDKLAGRLYVAARERDGFNDVIVGAGPSARKQDADQNFYTVRGQLLFIPDDQATFRFIADYSRRDENCCGAVQIRTGPTAGILNLLSGGTALAPTANPYDRVAYSNRGAPAKIEDKGVSLQGDIDLPIGTLTSISAIRQWRTDNGQDSDFTTADITYRNKDGTNYSEFTTYSQELRLAGKSDKFDWMIGAFLADERLENRANFLFGNQYEQYLGRLLSRSAANPAGIPNFIALLLNRAPNTSFTPGQGLYDRYDQRAKTVALFTNETWHVTDAFEITAGLRYTVEKKDLATFQTNSDGGVGCGTALTPAGQARMAGIVGAAAVGTIVGNLCLPWANPLFNGRGTSQERTDKEWSGTIKASYRFSPEVFTYASFARGYKGGGFNLDRTQSSNGLPSGGSGVTPIYDTSFPAEFVDSYELGMKNTLFNRSVLFNVSLFQQKFTDFQLNTFLGTSFVVRSIPEVTSKGVDADFMWFTPVRGLVIQSGFTYADTKYGKQPIPNDPGNALALLPGSNLSLAPKYSGSASVTYEASVGDNLKARFNIGAKYSSEYNTGSDLFPPKLQKAFTVVNGRVGLGSDDERWAVELWAQNLLNEKYMQVAFNGPLQGGSGLSATQNTYNPALDTITYNAFLGAPRTYGVTLRSKF